MAVKKHPLNDPMFKAASIMLSGSNFGCGSSREHAPQALHRAGFRAIIAGNFAEIFFGNSINLGMPCVSVTSDSRQSLSKIINEKPQTKLLVDVVNLKVKAGDYSCSCDLRGRCS